MDISQYQVVEAGTANTTFTTLARLADGFGVDVCDLLAPCEDDAISRDEA